jgi:glycosyltransferase involved in cell wall biosynthesis
MSKLLKFVWAIGRDFVNRPMVTFRYIALMPKHYNRIGAGIDDYLDLRKLLDVQYDILYSTFSTPSMVNQTFFLSQVLKVPFVLAFKAHDIYEEDNTLKLSEEQDKLNMASAIVTISNYNKEYIQGNLLCEQRVEIVHDAMDVEFFAPMKNYPKRKNSIITVARFHEQKGLIYLVRACHILEKRNISFHCTLIGRGAEERNYLEEIDRLNISNISIFNYLDRDAVRDELSKASIFVLPCVIAKNGLRDILANVLKEAMAMGLPVVTSDTCGIDELVEDGRSGILTPPGNPEALADALERLLADEEMRDEMGKQGRAKVEHDFNIAVEIKKLEAIFLEAVS